MSSTCRIDDRTRNKDKEVETELLISPQTFSNINSVQSIDMRSSTLSEFPEELFNAQELKSLRLDQNNIKVLPTKISMLANLEILSFSHNEIKFLDCGLGSLKKLKALALDNNKLEEWPKWLCSELSQLRLLYLHANSWIPGIPLTFAEMNVLERFSLDWFIYIQPEVGAILKSETGKVLISETRCLCRKLAQENEGDKESSGETKYCSFLSLYQALALKKKTKLDQTLHVYPKRRSILHIACKLNHPTIVKELIDAGYDLNSVDIENSTALSISIQNNTFDCSKLLLKIPALDVNLSPSQAHPLLLAIKNGRYDLAESIADHPSADVMSKDLTGNTALHILFDRFDTYPQLIQRVCVAILKHRDCKVNELNEAKFTPLHLAAIYRQRSAIRFASEYNTRCVAKENCAPEDLFDFNAVGGRECLNVFHDIAGRCDVETLFIALQNAVDVFARDTLGRLARDVVKDGMAAKLILKKERDSIRELFSDHEKVNKDVFELAADHVKGASSALRSRSVLSPAKKPVEKPWEESGAGVKIEKYTSPQPNMFKLMHCARNCKDAVKSQASFQFRNDLHKFLGDADPDNSCKSQQCGDNPFEYHAAEKETGDNNNNNHTKGVEVSGEKDMDEFNENEDLSTERKSATLICRPSFLAKNYTFTGAKADLTVCTAAAEEARILSHSKYAGLYRLVMRGEYPRIRKYRIVHYLFSKHSRDSKDILGIIFRKLPSTSHLKEDVGNLLRVLQTGEEAAARKLPTKKSVVKIPFQPAKTTQFFPVGRHSVAGPLFSESAIVDRPTAKCSSKLENYSTLKPKILDGVQSDKQIPVFKVKNAFSYFSGKRK